MENGVGCLGGMAYTCGCHRLPAFRNSGESAGGEDERGECDDGNSAKEDPLDVTIVVFFVVNTVPSVVAVVAVEEVFSITEEAISVIPRTFPIWIQFV